LDGNFINHFNTIYKLIPINLSQKIYIDRYLPIKIKDKLLDISRKSVCWIDHIEKGTGFFIKLPILPKEKPIYALISNNHVLFSESIRPGTSINIFLNKPPNKKKRYNNISKKVITLSEKNIIFTSELIDVTCIQLDDTFINDNPDIVFLEPCFDKCIDEELTYIIQYPKGKLSFASGFVQSISGFHIFHTASTLGGSSGSSLLNENLKCIGIHKGGYQRNKLNAGTELNIVIYALCILNDKGFFHEEKVRISSRKLLPNEKDELKNQGLHNSPIPNLYTCSYDGSSLHMLFYRTNHAWYFTKEEARYIRDLEEKNHEQILITIKMLKWTLINLNETIETIISNFGEELEQRQKDIVKYLYDSQLMYM